MSTTNPLDMAKHFGELEDPRSGAQHLLIDVVIIAILAAICGADTWPAMELFGEARRAWLGTFLALPHGIPTQYTFRRVFKALDPDQFEACFASWVRAIAQVTCGQVIAVDGKALRRSHDHAEGKAPIYMVSAWATANHLVLGQVQVDSKSNEITAIPQLLGTLDISGSIVTIDAMGCQKEIAKQIVDQKADYLIALKKNQPNLYNRVIDLFNHANTKHGKEQIHQDRYKKEGKEHGRMERRMCRALDVREWLFYLDIKEAWPRLRTIVEVTSERTINGKTTSETRYFVSSLPCNAKQLLRAVRKHWGVENELHWVLDIAFREDESRLRKGHGAHNMSLLRRLALNLLRRDTTLKVGIKNKRFRAALDTEYLLHLLDI